MKEPLSQGMFAERVVKLALSIPSGKVTTYGRLARSAGGGAMAAQSITSILSRAEKKGVKGIPWHRIVYSDGRVWVNPECRKERLVLYDREGIELDDRDRIINFATKLIG